MRTTHSYGRDIRRSPAALAAGVIALLIVAVASASNGTLRPDLAVGSVGDERLLLFTKRFCEAGRCTDATVGVTNSGRTSLPVFVGAPGRRVAFEFGFPTSTLRLTVRTGGAEKTMLLPDRNWEVPVDLVLPASIELEAEGEGRRATFLALLDRTAPAPTLDQASARRGVALGRRVLDVRFRLCSQQTGRGEVVVSEARRGRMRSAKHLLPSVHYPGCRTYRIEHPSLWKKPSASDRLTLRARIGRSNVSASVRIG